MPQGLSVSRLVNVAINLSPLAPARRSFGALLVMGDSNVIDGLEKYRSYTGLAGVADDFGTSAPEYLAAQLYYGQSPKPRDLLIGRWIRTATAGFLKGGTLSAAQQLLSAWTVITTGSIKISIDGDPLQDVTGLDFHLCTTMNGVAAVIDAGVADATVTWNGSQFVVTSSATGAASSVSFAQTGSAGVSIAIQTKLTSSLAFTPVPGYDAEDALDSVVEMADLTADWYGVMFAASVMPVLADVEDIAGFIQAVEPARIYGVTETDERVLDASYTTDFASELKELGYTRSFVQYSPNVYAVASFFGRAFSVNFNANRSTITMMYKQEPGITAELLSESQAVVLQDKRCNVFVKYDNDTAIIQYGVMSGTAFFDEIHGLDWLQNAIQNNVYTLLYTTATKIPQTDSGANQIVNEISSACNEAVNNGLVAPGVWNADGFGQLIRGQYLKNGFYIYAQPMALQSQSERETRKAPPIQVAVKLAGAIQEVDVIVNVNR